MGKNKQDNLTKKYKKDRDDFITKISNVIKKSNDQSISHQFYFTICIVPKKKNKINPCFTYHNAPIKKILKAKSRHAIKVIVQDKYDKATKNYIYSDRIQHKDKKIIRANMPELKDLTESKYIYYDNADESESDEEDDEQQDVHEPIREQRETESNHDLEEESDLPNEYQ
jgi:hypothetical protein